MTTSKTQGDDLRDSVQTMQAAPGSADTDAEILKIRARLTELLAEIEAIAEKARGAR